MGGEEKESAHYFREILSEEGFVIVNEAELPHAFYAEYGSGTPVIAILGEYDALPGLSQTVSVVMVLIAIALYTAIGMGVFNWLPGASNWLGTMGCVFLSIAIGLATLKSTAKKEA